MEVLQHQGLAEPWKLPFLKQPIKSSPSSSASRVPNWNQKRRKASSYRAVLAADGHDVLQKRDAVSSSSVGSSIHDNSTSLSYLGNNGSLNGTLKAENGDDLNGASSSTQTLASPPSSSSTQSLAWLSSSAVSYCLAELPTELRGVKDYMERGAELVKTTGTSPRWFCPLECGMPPIDAPLLLFLPGMDGTGLGMIRHYESLGRLFEVRCLHIPSTDRTPFEGLIKVVEEVLKEEVCKAPSKPIYLVGDSLGGALALAVAARNPKVDLVLVLANPSTSFANSQLQPFFPLLESMPDQIYQTVPFLLSFIMGDPVRMASATVDKKLPDIDKTLALRENLVGLLPTLPTLADIIPKETLLWKLKLLKSAASYTNSRLHAVKAEVLILASGKDQMLPSGEEARRLKKALTNCVVRFYKDSGHTLLLEDGLDLGTVIRAALMYRKSRKYDPIVDFIYPTTKEFEEAYQRTKILRQLASPIFFSKQEDGKIVQGLAGVPEEGPILLVGYHMLMGIELTALVTEFMKRKQLIRGAAHPILFARTLEKGLAEPSFNDDARIFGGFPVGKKNFFKVLSRKECALLYPGGAREALHRKGEAYKLFWPEQSEFVRAAARFGVTIVPFGVVGEDDFVELVADYDDIKRIPFLFKIFEEVNTDVPRARRGKAKEDGEQDLYMPLLAPKFPGRLYFLFGKPIQTAGREEELQNKEVANRVYKEVKREVEDCMAYLLKKREEDPYRGLFPRIVYEFIWGGDSQAQTFEP